MSIKQLNASYVAEEDRVVMRITTTDDNEYRLLLTRAMVRDMLGLVRQLHLAQAVRQHPAPLAADIAEFKQQAQLNHAKFTEFEPASRLPLGDQPLMVRKVVINTQSGQDVLEMNLPGKVLKLPLTDELSAQLGVVLQTIAGHAQWDLPLGGAEDLSAASGLASGAQAQKLLH
jgi:hypothetical protein